MTSTQKFDQPLQLIIKSSDGSSIDFLQKNSDSEISALVTSRVIVSYEPTQLTTNCHNKSQNENNFPNLSDPNAEFIDGGDLKADVPISDFVIENDVADEERCLVADEFDSHEKSEQCDSPRNDLHSNCVSSVDPIKCQEKQESLFISDKCNGYSSPKVQYLRCETHVGTRPKIGSSSDNPRNFLFDDSSNSNNSTYFTETIDYSESDISLDLSCDSISSDSSTDEKTNLHLKRKEAKVKYLKAQNNTSDIASDDPLLLLQTKVHVFKLPDSVNSNESASNLDKMYSHLSKKVFKKDIDFVHRHENCSYKDAKSDDGSFTFNYIPGLQSKGNYQRNSPIPDYDAGLQPIKKYSTISNSNSESSYDGDDDDTKKLNLPVNKKVKNNLLFGENRRRVAIISSGDSNDDSDNLEFHVQSDNHDQMKLIPSRSENRERDGNELGTATESSPFDSPSKPCKRTKELEDEIIEATRTNKLLLKMDKDHRRIILDLDEIGNIRVEVNNILVKEMKLHQIEKKIPDSLNSNFISKDGGDLPIPEPDFVIECDEDDEERISDELYSAGVSEHLNSLEKSPSLDGISVHSFTCDQKNDLRNCDEQSSGYKTASNHQSTSSLSSDDQFNSTCSQSWNSHDTPKVLNETNVDSDSAVSLNWEYDTTFDSSTDEETTSHYGRQNDKFKSFRTQEATSADPVNLPTEGVNADPLLSLQPKVHVLRLESCSYSYESASAIDEFYSKLNEQLFKKEINFIHRHVNKHNFSPNEEKLEREKLKQGRIEKDQDLDASCTKLHTGDDQNKDHPIRNVKVKQKKKSRCKKKMTNKSTNQKSKTKYPNFSRIRSKPSTGDRFRKQSDGENKIKTAKSFNSKNGSIKTKCSQKDSPKKYSKTLGTRANNELIKSDKSVDSCASKAISAEFEQKVGCGFSTSLSRAAKRKIAPFQYLEVDESPGSFAVDEEGTTDNTLYCLCNQVSYGWMVLCKNEKCFYKWFHFKCVGVTKKPKGEWFCPPCRVHLKIRIKRKI